MGMKEIGEILGTLVGLAMFCLAFYTGMFEKEYAEAAYYMAFAGVLRLNTLR
jgi:hypothetical protein